MSSLTVSALSSPRRERLLSPTRKTTRRPRRRSTPRERTNRRRKKTRKTKNFPTTTGCSPPPPSLHPRPRSSFFSRVASSAFFFDVFSSESAFPRLRRPIPSSLGLLLEDGTRSSISKAPIGRVIQSRQPRELLSRVVSSSSRVKVSS